MNRKWSIERLLHNDRLIFIISLVLAVVVWALVVYGPSNEQERTISGVPVTVSLGTYATDTLNMRIVEGQDITATVKVYGRRSVVGQLTAQDILLTADTSAMIAPGTYSNISVRSTKSGKQTDYDIVSVELSDSTIVCDIWTEQLFLPEAKLEKVTSADETNYQLGTPVVSSTAFEDGMLRISGPKTEVDRIASVVAVVSDEAQLSATQVFNATLKALDADGKDADITHCSMNSENAEIKVTVPILFYHKVDLTYRLVNAPDAYATAEKLVTFTPSYLELWGTEQGIESFKTKLDALCTFNFDKLTKDTLEQELQLTIPDGLKILGSVETVKAKFNLTSISSKKLNLQLDENNVKFVNCPAGISVTPVEKNLNGITVYGPAQVINRLKASDLLVTVDVKNESALGQRTLTSRISAPNYPTVWIYYGETASGYDLLTTVK